MDDASRVGVVLDADLEALRNAERRRAHQSGLLTSRVWPGLNRLRCSFRPSSRLCNKIRRQSLASQASLRP